MSERQRNPKLEIETNIPVTVTIGKMFYKGKNDYGEFFGYNLTANGSEFTFFASPFVHERFQAFGQGTTVKVVKRQRAGEKNATWEIGEVNGNGASAKPASAGRELKYEPSTFNREAYREQRIQRMTEALQDAVKVAEVLNGDLSPEDLRSIAISFVIEENRDRVPLNPLEKPPDANIPALLESIKKELTDYIGGQSEEDKQAKAELLEKAFGVRAWQPITQMSGDALIEGLAKLKAAITEEIDKIPF
jgi:hypothetical protein